MDHVAIMKPDWGLLPKILSGQKVVESRWYKNRSAPWGKIRPGETVYFKDSGHPVTAMATVSKVQVFKNLTPNKVKSILSEYGQLDGLEDGDLPFYYEQFQQKNYCMLIYLENPKSIKPFNINKAGFGSQAAWLCVPLIDRIKL